MPDGQTLAVANGGIVTDPSDRTELNLNTMRPRLSYIDLAGDLLEQVELPIELHRNSIRHLAVRPDGLLAFAMQWEGTDVARPPLLGLHRRGEAPLLAQAPLAAEIAMQGYAGSVAFSGDGTEVAITSPRGGRLHRIYARGHFRRDVAHRCSAVSRPTTRASWPAMAGWDHHHRPSHAKTLVRHNRNWDNHIVVLDCAPGQLGPFVGARKCPFSILATGQECS
ncbi:MAG: DUF1513 domain-containing protein [Roseovarius sp.]|nr:DUF1513 domain-containing protein [Roseovarius sp.]